MPQFKNRITSRLPQGLTLRKDITANGIDANEITTTYRFQRRDLEQLLAEMQG